VPRRRASIERVWLNLVSARRAKRKHPARRSLAGAPDAQIRHLSAYMQRAYVAKVFGFVGHFCKSPEHLGSTEIRTYLIHLTRERCLSASSIIVTVSALLFFYTVTAVALFPTRGNELLLSVNIAAG
jgi:Phage integrase, N-terminal SAM-like domain